MINTNNPLSDETQVKRQRLKKITLQRLKNIGLYYLQRFESSVANLRAVLKRRVDNYARENPEWNKSEAYQWIEAVLQEFERLHYLDDRRFAELKIQSYLQAGKPKRYIEIKLRQKGVDTKIVADILAQNEYDPLNAALKLAKRKKIGPYRAESMRREYRQKDMGVLVRAGFDYDTVQTVLEMQMPQEETLQ